jgi:hypothetical protein
MKNVGWVECLEENEKAILVRRRTGEESWFAKSVISNKSQVKQAGDAGFLIVSDWSAKMVGWSDSTRKRTLEYPGK